MLHALDQGKSPAMRLPFSINLATRHFARPSRYWLLAAALLLAQLGLLIHQTDFDAHSGGVTCSICLHASSLDNGLIAASVAFVATLWLIVWRAVPQIVCFVNAPIYFLARGPPSC